MMDNNNKSKKVLIMTVGTGATGADIAHGLFFSIKDSNPDLLILIGSKKSFDVTLNYLKALIQKEALDCIIEEKEIEEINDFEKLHFEYSNIIEELVRRGFVLNKMAVDYTSGTKAMSAALVSAALSKKIGSILYVYGERGEGGRVKSGTERRSSLSPNKIFSEDTLKKAIDYFNSYRYLTCKELLETSDFHPDHKQKANLLLQLATIFGFWDKFDFVSAFETLRKIDDELLKVFQLKNKFENYYKPMLNNLKSERESYNKILDLVGNANRRAIEGKYDDAIARLYRALEMLGQLEFQKEFHCSTSDVIIDKIPEKLRENIKFKYLDKKSNKIKIPLFGTYDILADSDNEIGLLFRENWDKIQRLISLRNESILAHGNVPLHKDHFNDAMEILKNFISLKKTDFVPIDFPKIL